MPATTAHPTIPCLRHDASRDCRESNQEGRRVRFGSEDSSQYMPAGNDHEAEYDLGCVDALSPWSGAWTRGTHDHSDADDDEPGLSMGKARSLDMYQPECQATSIRARSSVSCFASNIKNTFIHFSGDESPTSPGLPMVGIRTEPAKVMARPAKIMVGSMLDEVQKVLSRSSFGTEATPKMNMCRIHTEDSFGDAVCKIRTGEDGLDGVCKLCTEDGFETTAATHHGLAEAGASQARPSNVRLYFEGQDGTQYEDAAVESVEDPQNSSTQADSEGNDLIDSDALDSDHSPVGVLSPEQTQTAPFGLSAGRTAARMQAPPGVFGGAQPAPVQAPAERRPARQAAPAAPVRSPAPAPAPATGPGVAAYGQTVLAGLPTNLVISMASALWAEALAQQLRSQGAISAAAGVPGRAGNSMAGRVWSCSQDAAGCREVQAAFGAARSDDEKVALAMELRGHIWEALTGPFAKNTNHVVQKCILTVRPQSLQFIVEEIAEGGVATAAKSKFGCRIIKRLLDRCSREQVHGLVEAILADGRGVSQHPYGSHVMQHLLKRGPPDQRRRLFAMLKTNIRSLSSDLNACGVVNAALTEAGGCEERVELARAMLREPGLLVFLACTHHGHQAVRQSLELLSGPDLQEARRQLNGEAAALTASRYGRQVVACTACPTSVANVLQNPIPEGRPVGPQDLEQKCRHGNIWKLAQDPQGCREVQRALEEAPSDEAWRALAVELQGRIWAALRCPHANHVIQKLIETARADSWQFVVDELMEGDVVEAAQHKYGSRIVQRVIEQSNLCQASLMTESLVARGRYLARHAYGNYVVQHILEHGSADQRRRMIVAVEPDLCELSTDPYGCAVAGASVCFADHSDKVRLASALLTRQGLLAEMSVTRHGHVAVKRILGALDGEILELAHRALNAQRGALSSSRYGRSVLGLLQ